MRHRIKLPLLSAALLAGLAPSLFALEPKAGIKGPSQVTVGDKIWLQFTGCQGDSGPFLKSEGPEALKPVIMYTRDDAGEFTAASALVTCTVPGPVTFSVVMIGHAATPAPPAPATAGPPAPAPAPTQDVAVATLTIVVNTPSPPEPPPAPTPGPGPAPAPAPAVLIPPTTQLYAVAAYSGDTTSANELAFAAVRDDPTLKASLQALGVDWRAWDTANPKLDSLGLRPYLTALGTTPAILIYDAKGNIYSSTGAPSKSAIAAPLTTVTMVGLFKKLRGQN